MRDGWRFVPLGDLARWTSGGTPRRSERGFWGGDIPWISGASMSTVRVWDSERRVTRAGLDNGSRLAKQGSTLILVRGMSLHDEVRIGHALRDVAFNQDVKALTPTPDVDGWFLTFALLARHDELLGMVHAAGHGTGVLATDRLKALPIAVPPLGEQRRIARALGSLDDLADNNERLAARLEALLAELFARAGFDREPRAAGPLGELVDVNPVRAKPPGQAPYIDMASLPTRSARVRTVTRRPARGGARFMNGDTVMARITPCLENGKTAFIDVLADNAVGVGSTEFIVLRAKPPLPPAWSYFLARSPRFREHVVRHMTGSSGRQRCPARAVERYPIERPTAAAAAAFATAAGPLLAALRQLDEEADDARRVRDGLLPGLLAGRRPG